MSILRSNLSLFAIFMVLALQPAWSQDKVLSDDSTLAGILDRGALRVCFEVPFVPFEMIDKRGGLRNRSLRSADERRGGQLTKFAGFDIDLGRAMARELGVSYTPINTKWASIIVALNLGRCDIIMSGMSITEERSRRVDFSDSYLAAGQTILLNAALKGEVTSYKDLNDPKYTLASHPNTTGEQAVQALMPKATYMPFDDDTEAVNAVREGKVHAFIYDLPFNSVHLAMHGDQGLVLLDQPFTQEDLGWAIRKGDPAFLAWINKFLAKIKQDGTLDKIYDRWFVQTDWFAQVR